jgi:nucleotide-binding universal stress UspA family protein
MIETILVALDDSPASFHAAAQAAELAAKLQARLVAVSVLDGRPFDGPATSHTDLERGEAAAESVQLAGVRAAQRHLGSVASAVGVEVEIRVTHGHVADSLLDQVGLVDADLIVVGRQHRPGVRLSPHRAEQILEFSEVPVLVVPATRA